MKTITFFLYALFMAALLNAQIIHVPANQPTIQAGIDAATQGDTVLVADGTYFENINFSGKAITVASEFLIDGDETHITNTVINGSQAANPDNSSTVELISGEDTTSVICGFTITGGGGLYYAGWNGRMGGGVAVFNSGAKIIHNIITENSVEHSNSAGGSGIGAQDDAGTCWLVVRNNTITHNSSIASGISAFAGGIGCMLNSIIQDNVIEYNECQNQSGNMADGGAIEVWQINANSITTEISGNQIRYNTLTAANVAIGAGIVIAGASAYVHHNTIAFNHIPVTSNGIGAGIYVEANLGMIDIANNEITGNEITSSEWARGGGISIWEPPSKINITGNTIQGNAIEGMDNRGPGVWIRYPSGSLNITGNLFKENTGPKTGMNSAAGGGLCILDATGEVVIDRNMFKGNDIYNGGGLYFRLSAKTTVTNNVFDGNKSVYGGGISFYDPTAKSAGGSNSADLWPLVANNTLINNEASAWGGGIYLYSNEVMPVIFNCIIRDNTASAGNDIYSLTGAEFLLDHSNVNTSGITGNWSGGGNINAGPAFLDDSCHLASNCVCVEAGAVSVTFNDIQYTCPDHDIDGDYRPMNNTADIGVDEVLLTGLDPGQMPDDGELSMNVGPNPFSDELVISYCLPEPSFSRIEIFSSAGIKVREYSHEYKPGAVQKCRLHTNDLPAGVYLIRLQTGTGTAINKTIKLH